MTAVDVSPHGTQVVYSTCAYRTDPEFTYTPSTRHGTDADGNPIIRITSVDPNPELLNYDHELVRAQIDSSEPQRLTYNTRFDSYPAWSPDGTHIAFVSDTGISIMATGGSGVRSLNVGLASVAWQPPVWSPDGDWLAVAGNEQGQQGRAIHIVAADGQGSQKLTSAVSGASWSPDGQRLAFAKPDGAEVALYTIAADGSDSQRVATIEGWHPPNGAPEPSRAWIETVAWSPDGSRILYSCSGGICVVSLDGSAVSEAPLPGNVAAWSPDGSRIAILSSVYDAFLQTVAPDGTDIRVLVRPGADGAPQAAGGHPRTGPEDVAGCAAGVVVAEPATNRGLVRDCEVLMNMRDALAGAAELNWSPDRPIADWEGVALGGSPLRVHRLFLDNRGLSGFIPSDVSELTELQTLSLGWNHLGRSIPPELGELSELAVLALSYNNLQGAIPPELGKLTQLRELYLNNNGLRGEIPTELGQLTSLVGLSLVENHLTGSIPVAIGQLTNLEFLDLGHNQLTGVIPAELHRLTVLVELHLDDNELSGEIPVELGQLTNLQRLDFSSNEISGAIPREFGQLASLILMYLNRNGLTGPLPAELGQLTNLRWLDLSSNRLSGKIPAEFGQLTANLQGARFSINQLTGTIPKELAQLTNLKELALGQNYLTGCVPPGVPTTFLGLPLPACES